MDKNSANIRYRVLFGIMIALLVTGGGAVVFVCIRYFLNGEALSPSELFISIGIGAFCLLATLVIAKRMKVYKQSVMYDEFGVRRDVKTILDLNSKDREALELQAMAELERVLPARALESLIHDGSKNPDADLDKMVGLSSVKQRIKEMEARMEFEDKLKGKRKKELSASKEGHHMVLTGNPGTGKTTVCRVLTGLLYEYEYLSKNKVIEVDGNFLKSGNADMTQVKVRYLCRAAKGGVLFVDEAYALTQSGDEEGLQAIATLIKEMEDSRGDFVVIFAGYTNEMRAMLDSNPGFRSRIKEYLDFPDYNDDELGEIFIKMAKDKGFSVSEDIPSFFERIKRERTLPSWGNARTVRNILEESIDRHAVRFQREKISKDKMLMLEDEDISKYTKKTI